MFSSWSYFVAPYVANKQGASWGHVCLFKSNAYKGTLKIPLTFGDNIFPKLLLFLTIILSNPFRCANVTPVCSYQETTGPVRQEHARPGRAEVEVSPKQKTLVYNHIKWRIPGCLSLLWNNWHSTRLRHNQEARACIQVLSGQPWLHFCRRPKAILEKIPRLHSQSVHQRAVRKICTALTGDCSTDILHHGIHWWSPGYDRFTDPERALEQWKGWSVYRTHSFLNNWRRGRSTADTHANAERMRAKTIELRLFKDL